ncbi:hypothetical protein AJ80_02212 [Polytolypa hystricis UAMH7299]|uniref:Gamma-glutamylcyclotransferase AIG2-like domain-containing protein n=1 Tax=Polytolypa hystricis (strain UAMH7299) TaxID=1447883 RepID=A0A2B7YSE0_POLH7|nr:hypothetical protein AJ80_02212 [Polytolypa hystricis UAMH7299]
MAMENKPTYPGDYLQALDNLLSAAQLEQLTKRYPPIFLFGYLMLPAVLKSTSEAFKDLDIAKSMTQGTLIAHELYFLEGSDIPVVIPSSSDDVGVDGLLVFDLDAEQRGWLYQFESNPSIELRHVRTQTRLADGSLRSLDAGAFIFKEDKRQALTKSTSRSWNIDSFLSSQLYRTMTRGYEASHSDSGLRSSEEPK